ncbi:hypothetical protein PISMIDRAFT_680725 [Pisolithus microcarpus 441]|uniref:Unplaced genomic scaffold scaffold_60, whole genome shotgun sequence n=1 Tax=Pisolithus microcarpus 441 TaxID=765257 RepID=A0A0C9YB79_9AGAM|nr:hypothetical protein PISMIDRAFT_680725 [Pisolithus microcarpus 441]
MIAELKFRNTSRLNPTSTDNDCGFGKSRLHMIADALYHVEDGPPVKSRLLFT